MEAMPWDSPSTESKPMQNGTHSSGDETKQSTPTMVPMSVTRNMHNKQHERSAGGAPGPKDSMPGKGRGQVLQSMLSGNPPESAVGNVSNNSPPSREHDKMQQDKELDRNYLGEAGDMLQHGEDQSSMQQPRDNVQQGRENEQRGIGRSQGGMQQSASMMRPDQKGSTMRSSDIKGGMQSSDFGMQRQIQSSDLKGGMQSSDFRMQRQMQSSDKKDQMQLSDKDQMQSSDFRIQRQMQSSVKKDQMQLSDRGQMQSSDYRVQRQMQSSDKKDQMQLSDKDQMQSSDFRVQRQMQSSGSKGKMQSSENKSQFQSTDFRMQQGRGHGKVQPRNDSSRKMQAARKQNTKSNRSNKMGSAKYQAKLVKRLQLQRIQDKAEVPNVGRGKALATMLDTIYEPIFVQKVKREQKKKEIQYVLVDEGNKVEYIGVLEECPDVQAASAATPDRSGGIKKPHENVAQVLHLERSPPRPYREIPETYPGVHRPPAPYGYGPPYPPHPPPWFGGGYYGYYPPSPDPMAMDYWRPARPPPPDYYRPRGYRPRYSSYYDSCYKSRPHRFSRGGYRPHGYSPRFPSPYSSPGMEGSPYGVQIEELRSPSPNQGRTGSEQMMPSSNEDSVVDVESIDQQQSDVIIEETCDISSDPDDGIVQVAAGIVQQVIDDALKVSEKEHLPMGVVQEIPEVHVNSAANQGADKIEQEVAEMVQEAFHVAKEAAEQALAVATDILQHTDKPVEEIPQKATDGEFVEGTSIKEVPGVEKVLEMDEMAHVDDEIGQEVVVRIVEDTDKAAVERPDDSEVLVSAAYKQVPACISNFVLIS